MSSLKYKIIFLGIIFFVIQAPNAFSYSESLCWNNNCSSLGWTERHETYEVDFQCIRDNCLTNGWVKGLFESGSYTMCMNDNCQEEGFYEIKRSSQTLLSQTICVENNCRQNGSMTYGPNGIVVKTCKEEDCLHKGWQSVFNGNLIEDVSCLLDDCLKFGWKNFR